MTLTLTAIVEYCGITSADVFTLTEWPHDRSCVQVGLNGRHTLCDVLSLKRFGECVDQLRRASTPPDNKWNR